MSRRRALAMAELIHESPKPFVGPDGILYLVRV